MTKTLYCIVADPSSVRALNIDEVHSDGYNKQWDLVRDYCSRGFLVCVHAGETEQGRAKDLWFADVKGDAAFDSDEKMRLIPYYYPGDWPEYDALPVAHFYRYVKDDLRSEVLLAEANGQEVPW